MNVKLKQESYFPFVKKGMGEGEVKLIRNTKEMNILLHNNKDNKKQKENLVENNTCASDTNSIRIEW